MSGPHPKREFEAAPYITLVQLGGSIPGALTMNLDTWKKLPPNIAGDWVKRQEAKGLPARQVLKVCMEGTRKRGETPLRNWDKE